MIILFDVDGTLVSTGGAGRRAYDAAFAEEFGEDHGLLDFSFSGLTDRILVRRGLEAAGRDGAEEAIVEAMESIFERYLSRLPEVIASSSDYRIHPGVEGFVEEAAAERDWAIGLGTGNLEPGARLKLEPAGLNDYFAFGGFGSDAEARADVLRAGIERGAERIGTAPGDTRVVVIGDTPRDVRAAREVDAECLAVNTGSSAESAIREAGPDHFIEDLRDPSAREFLER